MNEEIISLHAVGEKYKLYDYKVDSLRERFVQLLAFGKGRSKEFWAVKDINLKINRGEVVGVIGENGSGKTTLLKLIAGILKPDVGSIDSHGKIAAILELGVGFQRELTGRENIYLNSAMLGIDRKTIDEKLNDIVSFAELEDFIDMPLKSYSSGMEMRLGFSIAVNVDPDVLLIDEVLIIGDEVFQRRCIEKIQEFKEKGKTIVLVSHSMNLINQLCDRVILLRQGRIVSSGAPKTVINFYFQSCGKKAGIAIIPLVPLDVVFNNGRLLLFWQKTAITPDPGVCFSFVVGDEIVYSYHAEWWIKEQNEKAFTAEGHFARFNISITWHVSINAEQRIVYNITFGNAVGVSVVKWITLFDESYEEWFFNLTKGNFRKDILMHQEDFYIAPHMDIPFYGVYAGTALPGMILESEQHDGTVNFSTSKTIDTETRCVVASFAHSGDSIASCSGSIQIAAENSSIAERIQGLEARSSIIIKNVKLLWDGARLRFYYNNLELTAGFGMYMSFVANGRLYGPQHFTWRLQKISEHEMIVIGENNETRICQRVSFSICDDEVTIRPFITGNESNNIQNRQFFILMHKEYSEWFYNAERGHCNTLKADFQWEEIILPQDQKPELFMLHAEHDGMPDVFLLPEHNNSPHKITLYNTGSDTGGRAVCVMNTQEVLSNNEMYTLKVLSHERSKQYVGDYLDSRTIKNGAIRISCVPDRLQIYYEDEKITEYAGLYMSYLYNARWFDAKAFDWNYEKASPESIKLTGRGKDIPLLQELMVSCIDNAVHISISSRPLGETQVTRGQLTLSATEQYNQWYAEHGNGVCEVTDGLHEVMLPNQGKSNFFWMSSANQALPVICFDELQQEETRQIVVQNSSGLVAGRNVSILTESFIKSGNTHICFSFQKIKNLSDAYSKKVSEVRSNNTIRNGLVSMFSDGTLLEFYYNGEKITRGTGLQGALSYSGQWFDLERFEWCVKKTSETEMELRGVGVGIPLNWSLYFHLGDDGALEIQSDPVSQTKEPVSQVQITIVMAETYEQWRYNFKNGICSESLSRSVEGETLLPGEEKVAFFSLQSTNTQLPAIILKGAGSRKNVHLGIHIENDRQKKITITDIPEEKQVYHICLVPNNQCQSMYLAFVDSKTIKSNRARCIFDYDKVRLYFDDTEITSPAGISTSILIEDKWYDAKRFNWHMEKISDCAMKIRSRQESTVAQQEISIALMDSVLTIDVEVHTQDGKVIGESQLLYGIRQSYDSWCYNDRQGMLGQQLPVQFRGRIELFGVTSSETLFPSVKLLPKGHGKTKVEDLEITRDKNRENLLVMMYKESLSRHSYSVYLTIAPTDELKKEQIAYTETKRKERTITSDALKIESDNSGIRLYYNNQLISNAPGLGITYLCDGLCYDMQHFDWQIEKKAGNVLLFSGIGRMIPIKQEIVLTLDANVVSINGFAQLPPHLKSGTGQVTLFIDNKYVSWYADDKQGETSPYHDTSEWEETVLPKNGRIDIFGLAHERPDMPACFIRLQNNEARVLLQNTPSALNSKSVTITTESLNEQHRFSYDIEFLPREQMDHRFTRYKKERDMGTVITDGELTVRYNEGRLDVSYDKKTITHNLGLYGALLCDSTWHDPRRFNWECEKVLPNQMKLRGRGKGINIVQEMIIEINNNELSAVLNACFPDDTNIQQAQINMVLPGSFARWHYGMTEGSFDADIVDDEWKEVLLAHDPSNKYVVLASEQADMPALVITEIPLSNSTRVSILDMPAYLNGRVLNVSNCNFYYEKSIKTILTFMPMIKAEQFINEQKEHIAQYQKTSGKKEKPGLEKRTIKTDSVSVLFDDGRIKIFNGAAELTDLQGLHSSYCINGELTSLSDYEWASDKKNVRTLSASGKHKQLDIWQQWTLSFEDNGSLEVQYEFVNNENNYIIDLFELNLFLKPMYTRWVYDFETGEFSHCSPDMPRESVIADSYSRPFIAGVCGAEKHPAILYKNVNSSDITVDIRNNNGPAEGRSLVLYKNIMSHGKTQQTIKWHIDFPADDQLEKLLKEEKEARTINNGPLVMEFSQHNTRLFFNNVPVTDNNGIFYLLKTGDNEIHSHTADITFVKVSGNCMKAHMTYPGEFYQTCVWTIENEKTLVLRIELNTDEKKSSEYLQTIFCFNENNNVFYVSDTDEKKVYVYSNNIEGKKKERSYVKLRSMRQDISSILIGLGDAPLDDNKIHFELKEAENKIPGLVKTKNILSGTDGDIVFDIHMVTDERI